MKPIFICAQGPSLAGLKDHISIINNKFPQAIWAGMNDYTVAEDFILSAVGKKFDYLFFSDPHLVHLYTDKVKAFLHRPTLNHFISDYDTILDIEEAGKFRVANACGSVIYSSQSRGKILSVSDRFYNSLTAMLLTFIGMGYDDFYLFGCDGGGNPNKTLYFGVPAGADKDEIHSTELCRRLAEDTAFINDRFWDLVNSFRTEHIRINNVCPDSAITAFKRISYEEV